MRALVFLLLAASSAQATDIERWREQVRAAECAFAASMAKRDFASFASHVADDAIFFAPGMRRGKAAVLEGWKPFYEGAQAPFSWAPDQVEVLEGGQLAYSTGLARDPSGKATNRFASVWRRESDGRWRVVLDNGVPLSTRERERAAEPDAKPCPP